MSKIQDFCYTYVTFEPTNANFYKILNQVQTLGNSCIIAMVWLSPWWTPRCPPVVPIVVIRSTIMKIQKGSNSICRQGYNYVEI